MRRVNNMNKGYILLYRKVQDNILWKAEKFSKGQAWIDLLLMANHEEKTFLLGNEVVKAEIGSVITSEKKLMERWKWGKEKVRSFLRLLEITGMIERRPDHKKTVIIIKNFPKYQTAKQTTKKVLSEKSNTELQTAYQTDNQTTRRPQSDREQFQTINYKSTNNTLKKENASVVRHKYGEYKNVLLSDEELENLKEEAPELYLDKIEALSTYMMSTGKSYKSHFATLRNWIKKDLKERSNDNESGDKGKPFYIETIV